MLPPGALVLSPKQPCGSRGFNAWTRSACLLCISSLMGAPLGGIYFSLQRWRIFHLPLLFARCTIERRCTSRHRPPHAAHQLPFFCPFAGQTLLLSYGKGRVTFYRQTGRQTERVDTPALLSLPVHFSTHLFCFLYHFNVFLWHIAASQPAGAAGRRRLLAK